MPASNVLWPVSLQRLTPWYPGQLGVPGSDVERGLRMDSNGKVLWVDRNHVDAGDAKDGTNPDSPFATVAAALTHCRPYMNDTIVVAHNAQWTYADLTRGRAVSVQEAVVVTVPGIRIVGLANGSALGVPWRPTGNNAVCISIRAMDVLVEGFLFWPSAMTGTSAIECLWDGATLYGESAVIRHNYFYGLAYGVQLDYAWNCHLEDNKFRGITTAAIHNPTVYGEPDQCVIKDNLFDACIAAINLPAVDSCFIYGNKISGAHGGTNNFINLTGGADNIVHNNVMSCTLAEYVTTCSDATSGTWGGNQCQDGVTVAAPT